MEFANLSERMKTLALEMAEENNEGETFASLAESYYRKRPQLLALLGDLYKAYIVLSDRQNQRLLSHISVNDAASREKAEDEESDEGSSVSYQHQSSEPPLLVNVEDIVAELVIKGVECEIATDLSSKVDRRSSESMRKIELQKNLLDVLEAERLVLQGENASLSFKVNTMAEENSALATECSMLKSNMADMARCLMKMRDEQRIFALSRKIEGLQEQIDSLEKRNGEYLHHFQKIMMGSEKVDKGQAAMDEKSTQKSGRWWGRIKKFGLLVCGPHFCFK